MDQPAYLAPKVPATHCNVHRSCSNDNGYCDANLYRHRDVYPYKHAYSDPYTHSLEQNLTYQLPAYCKKYACSIMKLEV